MVSKFRDIPWSAHSAFCDFFGRMLHDNREHYRLNHAGFFKRLSRVIDMVDLKDPIACIS